MNFLSNLFDRLFGRKKEEDQAPQVSAPVSSPSPSPSPVPTAAAPVIQSYTAPANQTQPADIVSQPTISAASLAKVQPDAIPAPALAPQSQPDQLSAHPSLLSKIGGAAMDAGNWAKDEVLFGVEHPVQTGKNLAAGIGQTLFTALGGQIANAPSEGLSPEEAAYQKHFNETSNARANVAAASLGIPLEGGIVTRLGLGALTGAGGDVINQKIEDPNAPINYSEAAKAAAGNAVVAGVLPETIGSVKKGLGNLRGVPDVAPVPDIPAPTPETIAAAKAQALEVAPGITSVNPDRIAQVDTAISSTIDQVKGRPVATLIPHPDDLTPGIQRSFDPVTGREIGLTPNDANLAIPTLQRNQEAIQLANQDLRKAIPGPRNVNDLTATPLSPQDMHAPDAIQEPANPELFSRPADQSLRSLYQPFPENPQANVRPIGNDIQAPLRKAVQPPAEPGIPPVEPASAAVPEPAPVPAKSRPVHQVQIEDAINSGDFPRARQIVDMLPENDPYKASMNSLLDVVAPNDVPAKPVPADQEAAPSEVQPAQQAADRPQVPEKAKPAAQQDIPDTQMGGAAKSGEIGRSKGKYAKGQEYEKTSVKASKERGAAQAANTSYEDFINGVKDKGSITGAERDTAVALQDRFKPGSPEHRALGDLVNKYHTEAGKALGTIEKTIRRTANPKQLTDRFANRVYANIGDDAKVTDAAFESVHAKNEAFAAARDAANAALDKFNGDPSSANTDAYVKAYKAANAADTAAKFEEFKVASEAAKGSKNPKSQEFLKQIGRDAGVYSMDAVDTSLLSSTRVMLNNYLNTVGARAEERLFGKAGAALARKLTGTDIGGGSRLGARLGRQLGDNELVSSFNLRKTAPGNGLVKAAKNFVTTGNTLGERNIYASAYSGIFDHYKSVLSKEGFTGEELNRRALVNSLADPGNVADSYMNQALSENAMSSVTTGKGKVKLETWLTDSLSRKMGDSGLAKTAAKALTRVTVGFPTVVARSAVEGAKRATLGVPTALRAVYSALSGAAPEVTAQYIKSSVKEAGSGATMMALGAALGSQGLITGSYPTDPDEQAAWKRENKSENSIKIGDSYYNLPSALGVFALPLMIGANMGSNIQAGKAASDQIVKSTVSTVLDSMPTDSLFGTLSFFDDVKKGLNTDKYLAQTGSALVRYLTPLGSLVNEVAKMFDPTVNDTTKGGAVAQFLARVKDGIPGLSNELPDKKVEGNTIYNPSPIERFFGAVSSQNQPGVQKNADISNQVNETTQSLQDYGVFDDSIRNILDDNTKSIFDDAKSGKEVSQSDLESLIKGVTKNVDSGNTRFLEDGNYDANLAVLKTKRDLLASDPTTTHAELDKYDLQIKRGEVYKQNKTPVSLIDQMDHTSLSEWRDLGDPKSDTYDPTKYEQLWELDTSLAKSGASFNTNDPEQQKYSAKKAAAKKGGSGVSKAISSNTIGTPLNLGKVSLAKIVGESANVAPVPKIAKLKPGDLIKKRKISVS